MSSLNGENSNTNFDFFVTIGENLSIKHWWVDVQWSLEPIPSFTKSNEERCLLSLGQINSCSHPPNSGQHIHLGVREIVCRQTAYFLKSGMSKSKFSVSWHFVQWNGNQIQVDWWKRFSWYIDYVILNIMYSYSRENKYLRIKVSTIHLI